MLKAINKPPVFPNSSLGNLLLSCLLFYFTVFSSSLSRLSHICISFHPFITLFIPLITIRLLMPDYVLMLAFSAVLLIGLCFFIINKAFLCMYLAQEVNKFSEIVQIFFVAIIHVTQLNKTHNYPTQVQYVTHQYLETPTVG